MNTLPSISLYFKMKPSQDYDAMGTNPDGKRVAFAKVRVGILDGFKEALEPICVAGLMPRLSDEQLLEAFEFEHLSGKVEIAVVQDFSDPQAVAEPTGAFWPPKGKSYWFDSLPSQDDSLEYVSTDEPCFWLAHLTNMPQNEG